MKTLVKPTGDSARFRVIASAALPNGDLVFATEANVPPAGEEVTDRRPALFTLDAAGVCRPFVLPVAGGKPVTRTALPVAVAPDGSLYIWDRDSRRIVSDAGTGTWNSVVDIPASVTQFQPIDATVARDGTLYVKTDASVFRVRAGHLEIVAGTEEVLADGQTFPPPDIGPFPRPATSQPLPLLTGLTLSPDGDLLAATASAILGIDQTGDMRIVADSETTKGQPAAISPLHEVEGAVVGSAITGIAATGTGDLLLSDTGLQRVIRISGGKVSVVVQDVAAMSPGEPFDANTSQLLLLEEAGSKLAILGLQV
jgi:hypothetical protein